MKIRKRKLRKKLNIQVKESNPRKVRVGHCCPSYLAPESSTGAICAHCQEPWPVASAWDLHVTVHRGLTEPLTIIAAAPHSFAEGTTNDSALLHGHFRMDGLAEKEHPCPVPAPSVEDSPSPPHMLFWCNAEISTNQIRHPKSTISRDWRKARGKGMTHKHQTTKGTNEGTLSLAY